jgi:hypothetical protein
MPQSLTKLYAHLIFSTKNRQPFLEDDVRPRVHAYLATITAALILLGSSWEAWRIMFIFSSTWASCTPLWNMSNRRSENHPNS